MAEVAEQKAEEVKFYSHEICPFAFRAWLILKHKKIPHEFIRCESETIGKKKQDFFKEAYAKALGRNEDSTGKVPILYHNGKYITESMVIARYLEHVFSDEAKYGAPLLPTDPFERASVEAIIAWFSDCAWIKSHYASFLTIDKEKADETVVEWKKKWKILNQRLSQFTDEGLFLGKNRLSLFECAAFGFFERLIVIQELAKYPVLSEWMEEFPRVKSWYNACLAHESIKGLLQDPQFFVEIYSTYRNSKKH